MAKDPAFLFYPNDFIGGTMGMTLEEKGAYLELLILQFNKGAFTLEQAKRALGEKFQNLWPHIIDKFSEVNGSYHNSRLKEEIEKRKNYSASRRKNREKKDENNICETYEKDMIKTGDTKVKTYVPHMENENENRNEIKDEYRNGGVGGNFGIAPEMLKIFKAIFPYYPKDEKKDFTACLEIAYKMGDMAGFTKPQVTGEKREEVLENWKYVLQYVVNDTWFAKRSLSDLSNEWQRLIQSINNGTKPFNNSKQSARPTSEQLNEAHAKYFGSK